MNNKFYSTLNTVLMLLNLLGKYKISCSDIGLQAIDSEKDLTKCKHSVSILISEILEDLLSSERSTFI